MGSAGEGGGNGSGGRERFADLVGNEVRRLPDDARRRPLRPPPRPPQGPVRRAAEPRPASLVVHGVGGTQWGHAPGFDRTRAKALRKKPPPVDRELDLHGHDQRAARQAVREVLAAAIAAGEQTVRIIHGRGLRSGIEGGVLRRRLPEWLRDPPHGHAVLAFATERHGGATLVLLRRRRRGAAARYPASEPDE